MGDVWLARPDGGGFAKTVALKLVRRELCRDENYSRMFIDEATLASSIHHPNVCETLEFGRDRGVMYMAMEWVPGDSLAGLMRRGDQLVGFELPIADACAGLHAAHETVGSDGALLGVVHRDISPPNILVSMGGQAKVSDFGIAKARDQLHERTRTGEVKGKFAYIPPEQIAGAAVDRRADVYAMGCVLYVITLGARPFGNRAHSMGKILRNEYTAPRQLRPSYPIGLETIVTRALAGDPSQRFQTARDMHLALEEWLLTRSKVVTPAEVAQCVEARLSPRLRLQNVSFMAKQRAALQCSGVPLSSCSELEKTDEAEMEFAPASDATERMHDRQFGTESGAPSPRAAIGARRRRPRPPVLFGLLFALVALILLLVAAQRLLA
jgi:eukaryotic-like serine/threonine-protein kinase